MSIDPGSLKLNVATNLYTKGSFASEWKQFNFVKKFDYKIEAWDVIIDGVGFDPQLRNELLNKLL